MNAKGASVIILSLTLLAGTMVVPSGATAHCGGSPGTGHGDIYYVNENVTVKAGNYSARVFVVNETGPSIMVRPYNIPQTVYILSDEQMANFTTGKEYLQVYNSTRDHGHAHLSSGKYWLVVDNRAQGMDFSATVSVIDQAPDYSQTKCIDEPFFAPDVSSGFVAVALVMAAVLTVIVRRR